MMSDVDLLTIALEAVPKALVYAAVILSVGAAAARLLLLDRLATSLVSASQGPSPGGEPSVDSAFARIGFLAAAGLLAGLVLRAWAHTAASFGVTESLVWENLSLIAWDSQWGEAWRLQMAGAALLLVFTWAIGQIGPPAWTLTALGAIAMCYLLPLLGHAEGEFRGLVVHGTHILGGGLWVGTLMAMVLALRGDTRDAMLQAFAPFAFAGAALLAITGLVAAYWYLQTPFNIGRSAYGWAFGFKMIFVADVATFGFMNWRRLHGPGRSRRRAGTTGDPGDRRGLENAGPLFLALEVLMALVVIALTAVMTELEHP